MRKAIGGLVIVVFDVILVKAWLAARAAAALGHGPAPSPVRYAVILGFSVIVLAVLAGSFRSRNGGSRNGGSRGGSGYSSWSGR